MLGTHCFIRENAALCQYARMRDALNVSTSKTGRPIYYSITGILPYADRQPSMHCIKPKSATVGSYGAFTVRCAMTACMRAAQVRRLRTFWLLADQNHWQNH